jgi:hypothetical protein
MRQSWARSYTSGYMVILVIVLLGLIMRFYYAWQPLPVLIEQGMSDDAFYYLNIARNVVLGKGVSFDGITPTNGFHPLYLGMLIPLFTIFPTVGVPEKVLTHNLELNAQLGLSILMLFNAATAFPLYALLKRSISQAAGVIGVVIWLFNPWVLVITLAGVETAPYIFFVALNSFLYIKYRAEYHSQVPYIKLFILGLLCGLTVLARSDGIFLFIAIILDMLINRNKTWQIILLLVTCGIVLAPWLLWNYLTFGTFTQVSGLAVFQHTHFGMNPSSGEMITILIQSTSRMLLVCTILIYQSFFLLALLLIMRVLPRYRGKYERLEKIGSLRFLLFYAFLIFSFYAWYLLRKQFWYFMPLILVASVFSGVMHEAFIRSLRIGNRNQKNILTGMVAGVLLVTFSIGWWVWQSKVYVIYPAEKNGYILAQWIYHETEPEARIGSWNSGILGYLSGRTVINLDGVVNNNLYRYVVEKGVSFYDLAGLWDYVESMNIKYITDYEDILTSTIIPLTHEASIERRVELVYQFPSVQNKGEYPVRVYRLIKTSQ